MSGNYDESHLIEAKKAVERIAELEAENKLLTDGLAKVGTVLLEVEAERDRLREALEKLRGMVFVDHALIAKALNKNA